MYRLLSHTSPTQIFTLLALALSLAIAALASPVQAKAGPSIADYAAHARVDLVSISPSGDLVAFLKTEGEKEMVIVYSISQNKMINGLDASDITPRNLYFISDEHLIFIASEYKAFNANYRGKHEIGVAYSFNIKTGKLAQLLTPGKGIYMGQTWLARILATSPDKRSVYMPAYVARKDYNHDPDRSLLEVTLGSKGKPKILVSGSPQTTDYFLDDQGNVLAQERYDNQDNLHRILIPDGDRWKEIFKDKTDIKRMNFLGLSADGQFLVVYNDGTSGSDMPGYYEMSLKDGTFTERLHESENKNIAKVLVDKNRKVIGIAYAGFSPSYTFFDPAVSKRYSEFAKRFPGNSVRLASFSDDLQHMVVFVTGVSSSGHYYLLSEGKAPHALSGARPNITPEYIHPIGRADYQASDGRTIPTLITIPKDKVSQLKNLPAIMFPHGGPASQDRLEFDWWAQALANEGYLVIQPQFRGSTGFGLDHWSAGFGEWGKKMQTDLSEGIDHLVKKGMVDPNRVCIMGASYGGYAALAGAAFTPDHYKCVVSVAGVADLSHMMRDEKMDYGSDHWVVSYWKRFMTAGDDSGKRMDEVSPSKFAKQIKAPVLLIHGTRDKIVPFDQSKIMQKSLKKAKKKVRFVKLNKENHWLDLVESRKILLKETIDFIHQSIGERKPK